MTDAFGVLPFLCIEYTHGKLWGWKQRVAMLLHLTPSSISSVGNVQLFLWNVVCSSIQYVNITYEFINSF